MSILKLEYYNKIIKFCYNILIFLLYCNSNNSKMTFQDYSDLITIYEVEHDGLRL